MLEGKHIVLGITGSIAAYKACLIARLLIKAGAEVQVVITPSGKEFITPLTLSTLTQKPVISEFFTRADRTLGRCNACGPSNSQHHRQDGTWNSRQYAHHHVLEHESPSLRCSGYGS